MGGGVCSFSSLVLFVCFLFCFALLCLFSSVLFCLFCAVLSSLLSCSVLLCSFCVVLSLCCVGLLFSLISLLLLRFAVFSLNLFYFLFLYSLVLFLFYRERERTEQRTRLNTTHIQKRHAKNNDMKKSKNKDMQATKVTSKKKQRNDTYKIRTKAASKE